MKLRRTIGERVAGFVRDWSLPRQIAGTDPSREAAKSTHVAAVAAAPRRGRHGRNQHLPLLRGRLRAADLRQERARHPYRGRPAQPDQPGHAVPQGRRDVRLDDQPRAARQGAVPGAACRPTGKRGRSTGRWTASPISSSGRATRPSSAICRTAPRSTIRSAIGSLGGATLDNEENYLIKKLFGGGLGMVWIENQARI